MDVCLNIILLVLKWLSRQQKMPNLEEIEHLISKNSYNGYYFETATEKKAEHTSPQKKQTPNGCLPKHYFACIKVAFQDLRRFQKRSLLDVNEHFEIERNAEKTFKTTKLLSYN